VSVGTQLKKALFAPVPCLIVVNAPPEPAVVDSQRKVRVSPTVVLSTAILVVKVSVIPTLRYAVVGLVYVGFWAVMYRTITTPADPDIPAPLAIAPLP
jgi:hypothetical protein